MFYPDFWLEFSLLFIVLAPVLLALHLEYSFTKTVKKIRSYLRSPNRIKLSKITFTCFLLATYSFAFAFVFEREALRLHHAEDEVYCCIEDYIWNGWDYLTSAAFLFFVGCLFATFRSFIEDNCQPDVHHITPTD